MFGLNSSLICGMTIFLILFLVYIFSKFDLSILGSKLFSLQYASISLLSHSIIGLIYFPSRIGSMPFKPDVPEPLNIFIKTVSALSFALCAVAILFEFVRFATSSKKSYLAILPASSVPSFSLLAFSMTFIFLI